CTLAPLFTSDCDRDAWLAYAFWRSPGLIGRSVQVAFEYLAAMTTELGRHSTSMGSNSLHFGGLVHVEGVCTSLLDKHSVPEFNQTMASETSKEGHVPVTICTKGDFFTTKI
ncbi:MAG: hypothetical protein M1823_007763, partial [Watsoniomyces obsoletus]